MFFEADMYAADVLRNDRRTRVVALGIGPRIILGDHAKSDIGDHRLDLGLSDLPRWNPPDHLTRHF
jgi:hypothetical protein